MRIDKKVFEKHYFSLEKCYVDTRNGFELRKVWRKVDFVFEFVTTNKAGYFDEDALNDYIRPSGEPYCLADALATSEELIDMVRETKEIDRETSLMRNIVGEIIKADLETLNLSVKEFSEKTGIAEEELWAVIDGERGIDSEMSKKLAKYFDCSEGFWERLSKIGKDKEKSQ